MRETLYIRADADAEMGAGHVMRCLAIARAWMGRGGEVVVLAKALEPRLAERLQGLGLRLHELPGAWPDPGDLDAVRAVLGAEAATGRPPWLVLDGYHFDAAYMEAVVRTGAGLCVVDDLADRPFFPAHLVVNPNCYAPRLRYAGPPGLRVLAGSDYVLLREEFLALGPRPEATAARPGGRLLVTMGGGEAFAVLGELLDILAGVLVDNLHVRLAAGFSCRHVGELRALAAAQPYRCEVLGAVENMAPLLHWADGAVSAAGGTAWELAYAGLPAALVVLADNQARIAAALSGRGAALFLGHAPGLSRAAVAGAVERLMTDAALRRRLVAAGKRVVDGRGPERVVSAMKEDVHAAQTD